MNSLQFCKGNVYVIDYFSLEHLLGIFCGKLALIHVVFKSIYFEIFLGNSSRILSRRLFVLVNQQRHERPCLAIWMLRLHCSWAKDLPVKYHIIYYELHKRTGKVICCVVLMGHFNSLVATKWVEVVSNLKMKEFMVHCSTVYYSQCPHHFHLDNLMWKESECTGISI